MRRMRTRARVSTYAWAPAVVAAATVAFGATSGTTAQIRPEGKAVRGLNIAPSYEGFELNPDGSFTLMFGYYNRNAEEQPHVPVGPNNNIEPGGPDQGQPTYFFPKRNRFVFGITVPKDFGRKEIVWSLTVNGKTEKAYATLKPEYALEANIIQRQNIGNNPPGTEDNKAPVVKVEGARNRTVKVGQPLSLTAAASDDGIPAPKAAPRNAVASTTAVGLRVAWFVYRGPGDQVTFDPPQFKTYADYKAGGNSPWTSEWAPPRVPADGKFPATVTFSAPGTYVVRVMAHDGGFGVTEDVTVTVTP